FFSIQDRRLAPVADLGGAWQIYQFENTRSRPLADVWELVHERTLREHRSRQSHQEYEQLAHQLALRVRPEGVEAALALGSAGVAPRSLEEPLGARVLCDFDGASLTVRDFLTALLRIGFRSALRDSGHVMQLASSEVLPIYLFAAAARSQAWDKEPEFQEFAEKKKQQLMLKALEEQAAAESGPMEEKDIRAYYDRNKGQFRVPESVVIRRLYVDTWEQARDLREEIDAGAELAALLERPLVARHVHPQLQGIRRFFRIHEAHFPELVAGAFGAATGDVVGPVPVGDGFAVFEVLGHLEPEVQPYDKVRPKARRLLLKARTDEAMAGLIRKLREQHRNQITLYDFPVGEVEEL
ncbi:MAG: peptidylprolyl isomerase, partial [Boseongicola sp.]|nr:peptidylprolyl isomerase [Boseongicola sp.]